MNLSGGDFFRSLSFDPAAPGTAARKENR